MRFFFLIFLFPFLSGCSLPGTQTEQTGNTILYDGASFSLSVPKTWTEVKSTNLPTPKKWTIELAYIAPDTKYGFANNLVILGNTLENPMTSKKYSELNQLQTSRNYLEYTKIDDTDIIFSDDDNSRIYTFEARYNQSAPRMKFIQTSHVCGKKVYLIHLSLSLDKDPSIYVPLLKTFGCK